MSADREAALDEIAVAVAEATIDAWLVGAIKITDPVQPEISNRNKGAKDDVAKQEQLHQQDGARSQ